MKKRIIIAFFAFLLCSSLPAYGAGDAWEAERTQGEYNGDDWNKWDEYAKMYYLEGFQDGVNVFSDAAGSNIEAEVDVQKIITGIRHYDGEDGENDRDKWARYVKTYYIEGLYDGMDVFSGALRSAIKDKSDLQKTITSIRYHFIPITITFSDMSQYIDEIYLDPSNREIPIKWIYNLILKFDTMIIIIDSI